MILSKQSAVFTGSQKLLLFKRIRLTKLFFSGGIFCEDTASLCGAAAAIDVGGAVYRAGHNFVLYAYTSDAAQLANSGFKLQYTMLPCAGILGPVGSPRDKSVET